MTRRYVGGLLGRESVPDSDLTGFYSRRPAPFPAAAPADAAPAAAPEAADAPPAAVDLGPAIQLPPDGRKTRARSRVDEWMDADFRFGGSRIKRKTLALILLGLPGLVPLFLMLPATVTLNSSTFAGSVDDTLGTGAEICLFLCLLVTPLVTLTRQRWFVPLRRWYGILLAGTAFGDAIGAGITDEFAGGVFGRLAGHVFELVGFIMVMLLIPLVLTSSPWAQRRLGRYWKRLQQLTYAVWGLLALHLVLLEGFGFQSGTNGSGFAGDGDPIFHQRFYQFSACSLFLLTLRLPPVRRWIAARQDEGRDWVVYAAIAPVFALFVFAFAYIIDEEMFKGIDSFTENPSAE